MDRDDIDAARRAQGRALFAFALAAAGCGGGGGGGGDPASGPAPGPAQTPAQTPTPVQPTAASNLPPVTGAFGGGSGRLLFLEGGTRPRRVLTFDLATRRASTLATIADGGFFGLVGGVTRAADGRFVVTGYDASEPLARTVLFQFEADGRLSRRLPMPRAFHQGGAVSPDGRRVAFAEPTIGEDALQVFVLDLAAGGSIVTGTLLGPADAPRNKAGLHALPVWSDERLYVVSEAGLHRVDPATAAAARTSAVALDAPGAPTMSPDGREIWFEQARGNPLGRTIWSIDVAGGGLARRSIRSRLGGQYAPAFSPDGQWLLMQQTQATLGAVAGSFFVVSAVRVTDPPFDTQGLATSVVDADGAAFTASDRMVWF